MRNTDPGSGHEVGQRLLNLAVAALVIGAGGRSSAGPSFDPSMKL